MTYRMPSAAHCSFPLPALRSDYESKPLYSLFRKVNHSYVRISTMSYPEKVAYVVFGAQLGMNLELSLRKIQIELNEAR